MQQFFVLQTLANIDPEQFFNDILINNFNQSFMDIEDATFEYV